MGMMVHTYNSSTWESEAVGFTIVKEQLKLRSGFLVSLVPK